LQILIYYDNRWRLLLKAIYPLNFVLWIVYVPGYSVDYFHKNSERNISVVIQPICSAI